MFLVGDEVGDDHRDDDVQCLDDESNDLGVELDLILKLNFGWVIDVLGRGGSLCRGGGRR